jgi:uncharacterized protein YjbJ (UPF0337 family)
MGGKTELVKGRINEVAGVLTGYDQLRAEGKLDQAVGKVETAIAEGRRQGQESHSEGCRQGHAFMVFDVHGGNVGRNLPAR